MSPRIHARIHLVLASLVLSLAISSPARGQTPETGGVELRATGIGKEPPEYTGTPRGRLMAERAAQVVALRNLAQALHGALDVGDPEGTTRVVEGFLAGHSVVRTTQLPDGSVEVEVALPLSRAAANFRGLWQRQTELEEEQRRAVEEKARLEAEVQRLSAALHEVTERLQEILRLLPR